jgi:hypothetical protein
MPDAVPAIPVNPKTAAIKAIIKKVIAQLNITPTPFFGCTAGRNQVVCSLPTYNEPR